MYIHEITNYYTIVTYLYFNKILFFVVDFIHVYIVKF